MVYSFDEEWLIVPKWNDAAYPKSCSVVLSLSKTSAGDAVELFDKLVPDNDKFKKIQNMLLNQSIGKILTT